MEHSPNLETSYCTLGGGCFWCLDALFRRIPGVLDVVSGYAGGETPHPTYEAVCSGTTGHAEVIRVQFAPQILPLKRLLECFWVAHDPTTLNRQGADIGTQYRSIILAESSDQLAVADESKREAQARFSKPIVTEIALLQTFFPAESYHQNFAQQNPAHPYCRAVIFPKFAKFPSTS